MASICHTPTLMTHALATGPRNRGLVLIQLSTPLRSSNYIRYLLACLMEVLVGLQV